MHFAFALPSPAETGAGGGTDYINGLISALRELGHEIQLLAGDPPRFPPNAIPVIDGMLLPRLSPQLETLAAAGAVAVVHHIAAAAGRNGGERERVLAIERGMLPRLRRVIATSAPVASRLESEFGVTAVAILPGVRHLPRSTPDPDDPVVLSVGVLTRRKGHDLLLRAAARLADLPWRLVIAGDSGRDPAYAAELATLIDELGLSHRAALLADPTPEALEQAWASASVFALATRWEGYPSAVAVALRRGIPVLVTDACEAGPLVPTDAGAICPADDMATFGKCLRRLLFDHDLRAGMTAAAWHAGQDLPGWEKPAREFLTALEV